MEDAFFPVVIGVSLLAIVAAAIALATSGGSYGDIGRGGTALGGDRSEPEDRNAEIREQLVARNARRVARGEPALDVEAELHALTGQAADPEIAAEVRRLVTARNARLIARGEPPLDVEAEVSRRLREM